MKNTSKLLGLVCLLSVHQAIPVLVQVDTLKTIDKTFTFYSDKHVQVPEEQEQLDALIDSLQHSEKTNDPQHIFIEQPALWFTNLFGCASKTLLNLPKQIDQATPKFSLTNWENLDIRHISSTAYSMLTFPATFLLSLHTERTIDPTEKILGTFTFQDVLDEFVHIKQLLADYYLQQENIVVSDLYAKHITQADKDYSRLVHWIQKYDISLDTSVVKYTQENYSFREKEDLGVMIIDAFCPLFDLHI
ncbi:hypothetical protein H0W26_01870, partial [Candidatus Dependentiae bacterium]|nr:hypothetical protein [Candidatus Dependentiae bacterium]